MMAEGVLLFDQTAYRTVICHGLVVDRHGRKMSKSVGNVIDPMALMEQHGADAIRWYWRRNLIEPSARGASEVRRTWLRAVNSKE